MRQNEVDRARIVGSGRRVRHRDNGGEAAGGRRKSSRMNGLRLRLPRMAKVHMQINKPRGQDFAFQVHALGPGGHLRGIREKAVANGDVADAVDVLHRINHSGIFKNVIHFKHPATRKRTAMRTASPLVTCSRMTDCGPSVQYHEANDGKQKRKLSKLFSYPWWRWWIDMLDEGPNSCFCFFIYMFFIQFLVVSFTFEGHRPGSSSGRIFFELLFPFQIPSHLVEVFELVDFSKWCFRFFSLKNCSSGKKFLLV